MMDLKAVEFDFIVNNVKKTKAVYEQLFPLEIIEETHFPVGNNELVFNLFGSRFHLLDANADYGLAAPEADESFPFWFNVQVNNVDEIWSQVLANNGRVLQEPTTREGDTLAMFQDPDGYIWRLQSLTETELTPSVELAFVVPEVEAALESYNAIFELDSAAMSDDHQEASFSLFGTNLRLHEEDEAAGLLALDEDESLPFWFNVVVPDLMAVWEKAIAEDAQVIQAPTKIEQMGITNAMFSDLEGYVWMLHQIHEVVSFDERIEYFENEMGLESQD